MRLGLYYSSRRMHILPKSDHKNQVKPARFGARACSFSAAPRSRLSSPIIHRRPRTPRCYRADATLRPREFHSSSRDLGRDPRTRDRSQSRGISGSPYFDCFGSQHFTRSIKTGTPRRLRRCSLSLSSSFSARAAENRPREEVDRSCAEIATRNYSLFSDRSCTEKRGEREDR